MNILELLQLKSTIMNMLQDGNYKV